MANERTFRAGIDVSAVPEKPAGAGRYVIELLKQFLTYNTLDMTLYSRMDDPDRWREMMPGARVMPIVPALRPARLVFEQFGMPLVLPFGRLSVYHGPHYTLPYISHVPKVVTLHDMFFFTNPEWHERTKVEFFKRAIERSVKHAKALITISHFTAKAVREQFGDVDITVIPHGVDLVRFFAQPHDDPRGIFERNDRSVLDEFRIPKRYIAFVGTKEPRKNLPTLIRAFDRVAREDKHVHLVMAGSQGWEPRELDEAVSNCMFRDRIVQTGFFPERAVPSLLRQAAVVTYPAFAEGFGLPALEALACGAPLITTAGSAMQEVCGNAAVYFPAHDENFLAQAILSLLHDKNEANRLKQVGQLVARRYTWEKSARAHLAVYGRAAKA